MADINRITPGNPIIPPVPQDKAVDEKQKKQRRDGDKDKPADAENENDNENGRDGVDYYA